MKYIFTVLALMVFTSFGCLGNPSPAKPITILFGNNPTIEQFFYHTKTIWLGNTNVVELCEKEQVTTIDYTKGEQIRSLIQPITHAYAVLRVRKNFFDFEEYVVQPGDSVQITYHPTTRPTNPTIDVTILNRPTKAYDFRFEKLATHLQATQTYTPVGSYMNVDHLNVKRILNDEKMRKESNTMSGRQKMERGLKLTAEHKDQLRSSVLFSLDRQKQLLDSLLAADELSPDCYAYYSTRTRLLGHLVAVETRELSSEAIATLLHAKDMQTLAIVNHFYYPKLVDAIEEQLIVNQVHLVKSHQGETPDYREIFDQTLRSDLFSTPAKDYLLTKQIHRIYSTFSLEDFRKYYQIYEKEVMNQDLLTRSYNDFSLEFDSSRQDITSVALLEESGAKAKLEQVLEKHADKIVYVDFWASWCMPCRAAMKASQELRQSLSKEKVVFVYLSIDDNKTSWQKASVKEKLSDYRENYLIVNHRTSAFLKKAKLDAIPRYMIFDKSGRLMYPNAPRVEGKEIGLLLTQLARKP